MAALVQHTAVEVLQFNSEDPLSACRLSTRSTPSPGPDQILVRILCRSINPSDILSIRGEYPGWRPSFPAVPGLEGMGVVHQIGDNVTNVKVGQRVFPLSHESIKAGQGLWQEYIVIPAFMHIPIPDGVSDEVAAQFLINPWTVLGMFRVLNVPKGEYVLQTGAASVLGRMFIEYCHSQGVKTINVVRREEQKEELKALGGDEVINSTKEDVVEQVKKITDGRMAYGAIECVGGEMTKVVVESMRDGGTVLVYGLLGSFHLEASISTLIFRGVKLQGFWLSSWAQELPPSEVGQIGAHVMSLLEQKVISPLVGEKFPLHQFKEAILKSLEPGRGGKVLLVSY